MMEFLPYLNFGNKNNVKNYNGVRATRGGGSVATASGSDIKRLSSRNEAMVAASQRLLRVLAARGENFTQVSNYTDVFNTWITGLSIHKDVCKQSQYGDDSGRRMWNVIREVQFDTTDGIVKFSGNCDDFSLKGAMNQACKEILAKFKLAQVQMDNIPSKESIQGDATQASVKDQNTIITRDQSQTESLGDAEQSTCVMKVSSSEPLHQFPTLVGRWMPLKKLSVSTAHARDHMLASYYLPETFLSQQSTCAPNTIPFETFVYGQYDITMKFVVNANKFQCGKVIVSVKFDSYQADDVNQGFQAHLSRKHVILDLSANNEGVIDIPFRYHRSFVRNLTHDTASVGIRPGKYASVYVSILSPLVSGPDGATDMDIRPFYMIRRADFAGMSYKVPLTQMDTVGAMVNALPTQSLKELIGGVERALDQLGKSHNQDKPSDIMGKVIIPRPRLHFPNGKGVEEITTLRMNPTALTSFNITHAYSDEPKTMLDIARIWGLRSTAKWKAGDTEGTELFNTILDPTMRDYTKDYKGQPTPLEYALGMYTFWSGPIEMRFDFVSNSFHTGSVMISAEYNRTSTTTDECQSQSTYTKTFHLGEQKSVSMVIPYIYDTVCRRTSQMIYKPFLDGPVTADSLKREAIGIRPESKMRVKLRVVNALRPVASAPQEIEILVYMRAGKNFYMHGLKQFSYWDSRDIVPIDSFPNDNYLPVMPNDVPTGFEAPPETKQLKKREIREDADYDPYQNGDLVPPHKRFLPKSVANKWNERKNVVPQMDNGEKENEDSTDTFSSGHSCFGLQNIDSQIGIKDILRRPVLLFDAVKVSPKNTGFFVPIMPPSRMMQYKSGDKKTIWNPLLGVTPQAAIMNLFRFWRGSMRYTIMVHNKANSTPVYITHVPHSGTRLYGVQTIGAIQGTVAPIYGCGLSTEILIPCVNPTANVEVPYDTENNWTLTFDEDAQRNYAWRDKGDQLSGHLVISCKEDITISVWQRAGDDFEVANFYGIPECTMNDWAYQFSDEHARVQMEDFTLNNVSTAVGTLWQQAKSIATPSTVVKTAVCATPYLGPAYATATMLNTIENVNKKVDKFSEDSYSLLHTKADQISEKCGIAVDKITEVVTTTMERLLKGVSMATNITSMCYDVVLDIVVACVDKSWTAIGVGIVRFVSKILGSKVLSSTMSIASELGHVFKEMSAPTVARTQAPSREATITGILAGLIGTILGVKINPYRYTSFCSGLLERLTDSRGISYLMGVLRFVESIFTVCKDMIMGALGYVSVEAQALQMLSNKSKILESFVTDAQVVTSEANGMLTQDPNFRQRFWRTVMQAYQIQKLLITVPHSNVSPLLSKLCQEVIKVGNDKFIDISAAPVRYEPFVICIEGPPGIGKSELVGTLAQRLLNAVQLKRPHSGATYYRMPGSKFWSGYRDQPIVVYDDWMNLSTSEAVSQQISELYQLKSTSLFIPEMAHLEEKKIRGNPLIVVLLCNNAFPSNQVSNTTVCGEAVFRRRDMLLRAQRKEEYLNVSLRDMSQEEQDNFSHLEFMKYHDQGDRNSLGSKKIGYEATVKYLEEKFVKWHQQEQIKIRKRIKLTQAGLLDSDVNQLRLEDPFELYYTVSTKVAQDEANNQNAYLPSEILALEVQRLADLIDRHQVEPEEIVVNEEPRNPFVQFDYGETFKFLGGALMTGCTTTFNLAWLSRYASKGLNTLLDRLLGKAEVATCSLCRNPREIVFKCFGTEDVGCGNRNVCSDCMDLEQARVTKQCPACNGTNVLFLDENGRMRALCLIFRLCAKLGKSATYFFDACERFFGTNIWAWVYTAITKWISMLVLSHGGYISLQTAAGMSIGNTYCLQTDTENAIEMLRRKRDYYYRLFQAREREVDEVLEGMNTDMQISVARSYKHFLNTGVINPRLIDIPGFKELREGSYERDYIIRELALLFQTWKDSAAPEIIEQFLRANTQLDPFAEGDEEEDIPGVSIDDILGCKVREDIINSMLENEVFIDASDTPAPLPCLHQQLLDKIDYLRFNEGNFLVPVGAQIVLVSENVCSENSCYFRIPGKMLEFYTTYLDKHGPQLLSSVIGFNNAPANKQFHMNKIPTALRPEWMYRNQAILREVNDLVEGNWWEKLSEQWNHYKWAIYALTGVVISVAGIVALKKWFGSESTVAQIIPSGDQITKNLARTTRKLQRTRTTKPHFQQCSETPDLESVVKKYIARNYVTISISKDGEIKRKLTACGIFNRIAIMPRHYVKEIRRCALDGYTIQMGPALFEHEWKDYTFDESDFTISNTTDLALWRMPASGGLFKDIRKFVCKDADLEQHITTVGSILVAPGRKNLCLVDQAVEIKGVQNTEIVEDVDGEQFIAHDVICYNYSQPGACGSLVLLERTVRPIVAMHFAGLGQGTQGEGFGVILTQESLGEAVETGALVTQMEDFIGASMEEAKIILPEANVTYMGALEPEKVVFIPKKTKIRPSLIQNCNGLKPLTEPCILDRTDKRYLHDVSPLVAGAAKHGKLTRDFPTSILKRAQSALWDGWISKMKPKVTSPKKLTYEQAVTGLPDIEYYDPMILNTSAGYPYVLGKKKQKADYIQMERDDSLKPIGAIIDDEIMKVLSEKENLRKQGIIPFTPFIDTLKDERRKPEKARKLGGTRVFCNPPVDYVIAMRQNFLHFTATYMDQRFAQQHAVGINVNGTEWTQLARKLIAVSGNNVCTIDYANFGPGFNAGVAEMAMELMVRWTMENVEGVNEQEIRVLLYECLYSQHVCNNTVYHQKCGSPSGAPITVIINTLVNILLILIAWGELASSEVKKSNGYLWEEYKSNVALFCYGDDLIMAVSDKYKEIFNSLTITKFFAKYDIVATDASKQDEVVPYDKLTKATFLKQGFAKHEKYEHIWQSRLDWVSINDCTQWIWECADYKLATRENCKMALLSAHGWGSQKYNSFKEQVNRALIKKNIEPIALSWEEIDDLFYPDLVF